MASSVENLEQMYANLVIEDEDERGVIVANNDVVEHKKTYMLVGKFLTEKNVNVNAMQNVMAALWRPREGMEVHEMGGLKYSFEFFHQLDIQKVIDGGPWSFEQAMLVLHQVASGEDPLMAQLQEIEIWVQVYDIPQGFLSENILRSVGSHIGKYVRSDPKTFEGGWKEYVRIRVAINVEKPIKRRMKIKREGDSWSWLNLKYERLGTFCFVCGVIGHSERDCPVVYANPGKPIQKAYGTWLRAPSRNTRNNTGSRWLRNTLEGVNRWGKQGSRNEESTNFHGEAQDRERFTEVGGVIREKLGDTEVISIKSRDNRRQIEEDVVMTMVSQSEENVNGGIAGTSSETVVIETKRKRIEENLLEGNREVDMGQDVEKNQHSGPKNLQLAGLGVEARQGL